MTSEMFLEQLELGEYAWPGAYPKFFIMSDGEPLSFDAAKDNKDLILEAYANDDRRDSWFVQGVSINWEDHTMLCCHTGKRIAPAYGDDE
jgi:hypothetical protein